MLSLLATLSPVQVKDYIIWVGVLGGVYVDINLDIEKTTWRVGQIDLLAWEPRYKVTNQKWYLIRK